MSRSDLLRGARRGGVTVAFLLALGLLLSLGLPAVVGAADLTLCDDSLAPGFQDWSWAVHDLANPSPVATGSLSISWEPDGWAGLYFHADAPLDLADWSDVELAIHGGATGGQQIRLTLQLADVSLGEVFLAPAPAGTWQTRTLDLRAAGMISGTFDGIIFQDTTGGDQPTLFLDDIVLIEDDSVPPPPTSATVTVDPNANRRPINPLIYGVNFGEATRIGEVGYPIRRWGGNSVTRYNWQVAVHNTASDYFYQNIVDDVADPNQLPHGSSSDQFVDETLAAGAEVVMTAPAIGWTPVPIREKRWGFSVAAYGAQLEDECSFYDPNPPGWCTADSGDGTCDPVSNTTGFCSPDGLIVGNDPTDTSQAITGTFISDWVTHLISRVGTAAQGGVRYWAVDNEPMLWDSTHRDVFPDPLTYDGLWSRTLEVSNAIKSADPSAKVLGPVVWGWCAFFSSASDAAFPNGSCVDGPDRQAHGGMALLPWYLQEVCTTGGTTGTRPIDYLDVHFYPQGGVAGLPGSDSEDPTTAARRLRSVAELWDPTYTSESWVSEPIYLIPRLRSWIDTHCPGVGLAMTEYKWGGDDGASSALAHAEVLALFGREGVDLATRWVAPEPNSRVEDAYELFLNYDGAGTGIEGDSVRATSDVPGSLGTYAIVGPDGSLWTILINRDTVALDTDVLVQGGLLAGNAAVYGYDGASPLASLGTVPISGGGSVNLTIPARSVRLVIAQVEAAAGLIFADGFESGDTTAW